MSFGLDLKSLEPFGPIMSVLVQNPNGGPSMMTEKKTEFIYQKNPICVAEGNYLITRANEWVKCISDGTFLKK